MHWKLFATLAETAGERQVAVEDEAATVGDALDALLATHPDLEHEVLDDDGDLREHVRLLHEGADPFRTADGLATPVDSDDEFALFPPVSGG